MNTQNKRLLDALENGFVVNPKYAINHLGIYRLAARVYDLRKAGYQINKATMRVQNRFGEKISIGAYWVCLDDKAA